MAVLDVSLKTKKIYCSAEGLLIGGRPGTMAPLAHSDMDMGQLFETQPNPQHVVHQPNPTHFHISLVETILFVILSIF